MRATFAYTFARILLFAVPLGLLSLVGARGLLLGGLALVISGIVSFVVLSPYRDPVSGAIASRISRFRERLDEGTRAADHDPASAGARAPPPAARRELRRRRGADRRARGEGRGERGGGGAGGVPRDGADPQEVRVPVRSRERGAGRERLGGQGAGEQRDLAVTAFGRSGPGVPGD